MQSSTGSCSFYSVFFTVKKDNLMLFVVDKPYNPMLNSGAIMACALILDLIKPK